MVSSEVLVTPRTIAPAACRRATAVAGCSAITSLRASEPEVCGSSGDSKRLLDRAGDAGERPEVVVGSRRGDALVDGVGLGSRRVEAGRDDRVDAWVAALDQLDVGVDDLARAQLARRGSRPRARQRTSR